MKNLFKIKIFIFLFMSFCFLSLGEENAFSIQFGDENITVNGYLDPTFTYNNDLGQTTLDFLNPTPRYTYLNSTFGDALVHVVDTFKNGSILEVRLMPTKAYGGPYTSSPNFDVYNIVDTAKFTVPTSSTTSFFVGKQPAWDGFECKYADCMYTITHSLLFNFSEPGYFTGAGMEYTKGMFDLKTQLADEVNSGNNSAGMNTWAGVYRFSFALSPEWSVGVFGMVGENPVYGSYAGTTPYTSSLRTFNDFDWSYKGKKLVFGGQFDYGSQANAAYNGSTATWYGAMALVNYRFTQLVGGTLRADYFNDSANGGGGGNVYPPLAAGGVSGYSANGINGLGFNPSNPLVGAIRESITGDLLFYPYSNSIIKAEYRHDFANFSAFANYANVLQYNNNNTVAIQYIFLF